MKLSLTRAVHLASPVAALLILGLAMGGTWRIGTVVASPGLASARGSATPDATSAATPMRVGRKLVTGKLNLNTATEEQLMLLPSIGPSKAERIVAWRKRNGGFKRIADLRRVKGFGYKTFKKLEPYLDIQGESTIAPKR